MRAIKLVVLLLSVALGAAGCASGGVHAIEDRPTLAVPDVPPRTIEPQPVAELPPVEPIPDPPVTANPPPRRTTSRPSEPRPAEAKPETSAETTTAANPPPPPVAPLRTPSAPSGAEAPKQVRDTLTRAEEILKRVDYQKLSLDRRGIYDSAKDFIRQAEEKLKQEDIQLALQFAARAEVFAKRLDSGR